MAASFSRVEVGGVGMAGQHHGTGVVGDAVVWIGSKIVKELEHVGVRGLGWIGLLLS